MLDKKNTKDGVICHGGICLNHDNWIETVGMLCVFAVLLVPVVYYVFVV